MSARLFRRLRRCRALRVLALCAWMALAGIAWAQGLRCPATAGDASAMAVQGRHHDGGVPCAPAGDCCAHAPAILPAATLRAPMPLALASPGWRMAPPDAPRFAHAPPLRPPSA
jgi:hypothetical protein